MREAGQKSVFRETSQCTSNKSSKRFHRFNTCLVQKDIACFGIAEVEERIGLRFQHHPPCDCDHCRMEAKKFTPIWFYIKSAFDVLKSNFQTAHHRSRKRSIVAHTVCPTRHDWEGCTVHSLHHCLAEWIASFWKNYRTGLTTYSHLGTNRSKKRSCFHVGLPARPWSRSGSSLWPSPYRSDGSKFGRPARSDWWEWHCRSYYL